MTSYYRFLPANRVFRFLFLFFLFFSLTADVFSQIYERIDTANLDVRKQKSKEYMESSKAFLNDFNKTFSGQGKSYILKHFKEYQKEFNEELLRGDYIFDKRFDYYLDSIFDAIRVVNPQIPGDLKFYLSRNISLNAAGMGDNRFIVNLGTFYFLDNEHQLAAIISHELGHLMLKHHMQTLEMFYKAEKKDAKRHLSEVKSSRWNRGEKALEKYRSLLYQTGSEKRKQEFEADSMGYVLYKNTGFDNLEYINIYDMMVLYDTIRPMGVKDEIYRKYFDLPGQPFQDKWMEKEDFSAYDNYAKYESKFQKDSLRSHPEITERLDRLKLLFPELNDSVKPKEPDTGFRKLSLIAEKERMFSLDFNEEYGVGVYLCLLHLQHEEDIDFYKERMGEFFRKIAKARKEYTLNRYLERVSPQDQSESYITFLNFMWNLSLNELENIADYYSK